MSKTEHMTLRLPLEMKNQLQLIATAETTSVSAVIRRIVKKNLKKELAKVSHLLSVEDLKMAN